MKKEHLRVFVVTVVLAFGTMGLLPSSTGTARPLTLSKAAQPSPVAGKWEYKVVSSGNETYLVEQANELGTQGWELTAVIRGAGGGSTVFGYFKRPRS